MNRWTPSEGVPRVGVGVGAGIVAAGTFGAEYLLGVVTFETLLGLPLLVPGVVSGALVLAVHGRRRSGPAATLTSVGVTAGTTAVLVGVGGVFFALFVGASALVASGGSLGGLFLAVFLAALTLAAGVYVALVVGLSVAGVALLEYTLLQAAAAALAVVTGN